MPAASQRSVVDRIERFNDDRDPRGLRLKYRAMRKGPFSFFRGTCHLFYEDWPARSELNHAPLAWLCGDLHLENFGTFKGDNRLAYFDANDFDEAALAPCTWDVTRLVTSAFVGAKDLRWSSIETHKLGRLLLHAYYDTLAQGYCRWVERETATGLVQRLLKGLRKRTRKELLVKFTTRRGSTRCFRYGKRTRRADESERKKVKDFMGAFAAEQPNPAFFRVRDVAHHIAGTGSLGVERYVVLVEGKGSPDHNALLDVKAAARSALEPYLTVPQPVWRSAAERIVSVEQRLQAASPALLQAVEIAGTAFVLRALQPIEDRLNLKVSKGHVCPLQKAVQTIGQVAAWAHLRGSGRQGAAVADELIAFGTQRRFERQVLRYAETYHHRVIRDWQAFRQARVAGGGGNAA